MTRRLLAESLFCVSLMLAGGIGWLVGVEFYGAPSSRASEPVIGKAAHYHGLVDGDDSQSPQGPELTPQPTVVNTLAEKAHVNYDISHNDGLIIVDPQGRIRRIYTQADMVSNKELLRAVKPLLAHANAA